MPWLSYVWAAVLIAATAGFGFGAAAFLAIAIGGSMSAMWTPLVEAHGHLQLFGWGGLMVLGVGFFFLPRLRGAPLALPHLLPWILALVSAGLILRGIAQPALAVSPDSTLLRIALGSSGLLELAGATLALAVLLATARSGPPLRQRGGLAMVLPYLAMSFASLWVALAINALQMGLALSGDNRSMVQEVVSHLGLVGFLVTISVGVSARTFPLFLWLLPGSTRMLNLFFWPLLLGLLAWVAGALAGVDALIGVGSILEGIAFLAYPVILGVVPLRRRSQSLPADDPHYLTAVERLLVPSYLWLGAAGLLSLAVGASHLGGALPLAMDAVNHALGTGFITLLILGMAARMLPGFSGTQIASIPLVWATVWLGNAAALLRVLPLLTTGFFGWWPLGTPTAAMAAAGLLGLLAVVCLGINLRRTFAPGRRRPSAPMSGTPGRPG